MSADNYYLIRRDGDRFAVSCLFRSDLYPANADGTGQPVAPIHEHDPRFDRLDEAENYAALEYSEYGVEWEEGLEPAWQERERTEP